MEFPLTALVALMLLVAPSAARLQLADLSMQRDSMASASAGDLIAFAGGIVTNANEPSPVVNFYCATQATLLADPLTMTMPFALKNHFAAGMLVSATGELYFQFGTGNKDNGATYTSDIVQYHFTSVFDTSPNWTIISFPEVAKEVGAVGSSDAIIYAGGYTSAHLNGVWYWRPGMNVTAMPACVLSSQRSGVVTASWGNIVILSGGHNGNSPSTQVMIINTTTLQCNTTVAMKTPRYWHAVGITANYYVFMGGYNGTNALDTMETINRATLQPGPSSRLSSARQFATGGCNDRTCLVTSSENYASNTTDIFDFSVTDSTQFLYSSATFPSPASARFFNSASVSASGIILIAGGKSPPNVGQSDVFAWGGLLPRALPPRLYVPRRAFAAATSGTVALFGGGRQFASAISQPLGTVDMYFWNNGSMLPSSHTLQPPRSHLCAAAANDVILFIGGNNAIGAAITGSPAVDAYHIATGVWVTGIPYLAAARSHLACVGSQNYIFVSGTVVDRIDVFRIDSSTPYVNVQNTFTYSAVAGAIPTANPGVLPGVTLGTACFFGGRGQTELSVQSVCTDANGEGAMNSVFKSPRTGVAMGFDGTNWLSAGGTTSGGALAEVVYGTVSSSYPLNVTFAAAASLTAQQRVIFAGGLQLDSTPTALVEFYDAGWRISSHLLGAVSDTVAVSDGNGTFIIAGGSINSTADSDAVNILVSEVLPYIPTASPTPPPPPVPPTPSPSLTPLLPLGTTAPPPSTAGCVGPQPSPVAECIDGVWIITLNGTVFSINVSTGQQVLINGTIVLPPGSVTIIYDGAPSTPPIIVEGSASIDGPLYIILSSGVKNSLSIPIVGGSGNITGEFTGVVVSGGDKCNKVTGQVQQGATVSVLLTNSDSCKRKGLSTAAIAGITVGSALFLVLTILVVLLGLRACRTGSLLFRADEDELNLQV